MKSTVHTHRSQSNKDSKHNHSHTKKKPNYCKKKSHFPILLHQILSDPSFHEVVNWLPHGRSFIVIDRAEFINNVASKFFFLRKYKSFSRQLNLWGFSRVAKGPDRGSYHHELFLRGKPSLAYKIERTLRCKVNYVADEPPNFEEMSKKNPLPECTPIIDKKCPNATFYNNLALKADNVLSPVTKFEKTSTKNSVQGSPPIRYKSFPTLPLYKESLGNFGKPKNSEKVIDSPVNSSLSISVDDEVDEMFIALKQRELLVERELLMERLTFNQELSLLQTDSLIRNSLRSVVVPSACADVIYQNLVQRLRQENFQQQLQLYNFATINNSAY